MRGCFVTGTDTGAGKSVVAAAVAAALIARGERVAAFKPVVTGLDEPRDPDWPPDHELLALATDASADAVTPLTLGPPASPHLAARLAGRGIEPAELVRFARSAAAGGRTLVAEGVGGLLVPITIGYSVRDLACDLGLPVIVAARPGLGTISHTLLTLEGLRAAGLTAAAVVLTPWGAEPTVVERSNRETIEALGGLEVSTLPRLARADRARLAEAGGGLRPERWLAGP